MAIPMKSKNLLKSTQKKDRDSLRTRLQILIDLWEPTLGVNVRAWDIKKLKTYWASVNESERLITFNEKLADMPDAFVEVIVVHELVHLLTDGHDKKFYTLMDRHVPNWVRLHAKYADPLMQHN